MSLQPNKYLHVSRNPDLEVHSQVRDIFLGRKPDCAMFVYKM